jgi:hypothetical protein
MEIAAAAVLFALAMLGMGLGVMLGRKPLKGSCGGTGGGCPCSPAQRARCSVRGPR